MELFRISKKTFTQLDGNGGLYYPGRWHNIGNRVVYAAQSRSLAALETLVHLSKTQYEKHELVISTIFVPDDVKCIYIEKAQLPDNWATYQHLSFSRSLGDTFIQKQKHLICRVPSAIIDNEYNYLINPQHPEIKLCKIIKQQAFVFDNRLF